MRKPIRFCLSAALVLKEFICVAQPFITQQPTSQTVIAGNNATFNVLVSGTGPFSYQWQFNGANFPAIIWTVAGNGTNGYSGDGGLATNAMMKFPNAITVDSSGNQFVSDFNDNRIRKVSTNGIITTIAGNGMIGSTGDFDTATNAYLNSPCGVAVDVGGNLFIADAGNNRIRKVDTSGIITTIAGNGTPGLAGTYSNGDGGLATKARLNFPCGIALDLAGNLFIADEGDQRIRKVSTNGIITSVAGYYGNGYSGDGGPATNAYLNSPCGVAVDVGGNLFIADIGNNRIRKVNTNGIISTVAGNGQNNGHYIYSADGVAATNAFINMPTAVAVDAAGNLFFTDGYESIRKVETSGIISTEAGNGSNLGYTGDGGVATNALFNNIRGLTIDSAGNLFVADSGNSVIREIGSLPSLVITNAEHINSGNYLVVATSSSGSVTSSIASLIVTPVGYNQISSPVLSSSQMFLSFVGFAETNYVLERSFSLSPANWIPQATNPADGNGNLIFSNTPIATTNNFWRIRSMP